MELQEKASIEAQIAHENYLTRIHTANHQILADEPIELGGQDLGFSPFDLLAASLGACTSITLKMYANLKQINLQNLQVTVKLWADERNENVKFFRTIQLEGDLSDELRQRMLKVANSCPVHKVLTRQIEIHTDLI
ncbi:MAG: OsmC family protein [Microscillaceae bacterium]|jgi:putative redox protein|nr:OsmC family protein [Microscillaceae bacterium]